MEITVRDYKHSTVIAIKGRVDRTTVPQINQTFETAINRGKYNLIVDLSQLQFISSAGLYALLMAQKNIRHGDRGEVVLVGAPSRIQEALKLVGFADAFNSFDDLSSAMQFVASLPGKSTTDAPPPSEKDEPKSK